MIRMPYQCENDGQPAVMAISNLDTGAVVSPCQDCLLPALLGMVLALTPEGYSAELLTAAELELVQASRPAEPERQSDSDAPGVDIGTVEPEAGDSGSGITAVDTAATGDDDGGPGGFTEATVARALADAPDPATATP
jgi:hypothetical protein